MRSGWSDPRIIFTHKVSGAWWTGGWKQAPAPPSGYSFVSSPALGWWNDRLVFAAVVSQNSVNHMAWTSYYPATAGGDVGSAGTWDSQWYLDPGSPGAAPTTAVTMTSNAGDGQTLYIGFGSGHDVWQWTVPFSGSATSWGSLGVDSTSSDLASTPTFEGSTTMTGIVDRPMDSGSNFRSILMQAWHSSGGSYYPFLQESGTLN